MRRLMLQVIVVLLFVFCLVNIYYAVDFTVTSSHAYFDRARHRNFHNLFGFFDNSNEKPHNNSEFNFTEAFGIEKHGREISSFRHRHSVNESLKGYFRRRDDLLNNSNVPTHTVVDGVKRELPLWQHRLLARQNNNISQDANDIPHFLVELLQVRIYETDKARWTLRELKQWMHYMFLIGVDHIYVCDHYEQRKEMLAVPLKKYIEQGLVTYMEWGEVRHPLTAQRNCYQHIIDQHKHDSVWQMAVDMDEYPFSLTDTDEDFLVRFLRTQPRHISEISMSNYLMLGQGDRAKSTVIDRMDRMTPSQANVLVKPIYRPTKVRANIHVNHLLGGKRLTANADELKMLHYWGARLQDWGPDTQHTRDITVPMTAMRESWTERLVNSLLTFGEYDAFSNVTGP